MPSTGWMGSEARRIVALLRTGQLFVQVWGEVPMQASQGFVW